MEEKKRIEGENVDANNGKASSTHQQVITSTKNKQQQLADTFSKISNKASSSELTKTVQTLRERGISPEEVLKAVQEQQKLEKAGLTTMDALRNAGTIADIKNTVKEMIEHNSPDIEFFTQGSEGMIYKMKVVIDNTFHTFIAMKKRFDNNISHESKMLAHANNLVVDSDRKGFSTPAIRAKVPNFIGPVSAKDLEDGTKIAEYLVMEYVEGKTLYTLQLEAIIKKMQEKVRTLKLFTFEEWEAEFLENLKKERLKEKEQKLEKKRAIFTDNLSNAENQLRSKSPEQKKKLMQQIKEKYEQELKEQEAAIKNAYFLRGPAFIEKKEALSSKLKNRYIYLQKSFEEYQSRLVEKTIDFADDNQSKANYTVLRDDYLSIMEECKSLLKGDFWQFPDVHLRDTRKESQNATTTEFLRFVQNENLPIFSPEERREISNRITNTLEIFHSHHFYHRDLGQNPRNLIIKRDNGKVIPYIIDFGVAIEDKRYEEGPEVKYDPQHGMKANAVETHYAKDNEILSFITSGEEE